MQERSFEGLATRVDRYLRDETTPLAEWLRFVSPKQGDQYLENNMKGFGRALSIASLPLATCAIGAMALASKIEEPLGHVFYVQPRVGKDGEIVDIYKIRTMRENSHSPEKSLSINSEGVEPEEDERNTSLGRRIRAFELDEIPQLFQAAFGQISFFGTRIIADFAIDQLRENRPNTFDGWYSKYTKYHPGIFNLFSAVSNDRKNSLKKYHYDMLYFRKASLGLNLFIIYRTGVRMIRKLEEKIKKRK